MENEPICTKRGFHVLHVEESFMIQLFIRYLGLLLVLATSPCGLAADGPEPSTPTTPTTPNAWELLKSIMEDESATGIEGSPVQIGRPLSEADQKKEVDAIVQSIKNTVALSKKEEFTTSDMERFTDNMNNFMEGIEGLNGSQEELLNTKIESNFPGLDTVEKIKKLYSDGVLQEALANAQLKEQPLPPRLRRGNYTTNREKKSTKAGDDAK